MTPEEAIDIVALSLIASAACDRAGEGWEDCPEIGEHWMRIAQAMDRLAPDPDPALLAEAYALLEGVVVSGMVEVER